METAANRLGCRAFAAVYPPRPKDIALSRDNVDNARAALEANMGLTPRRAAPSTAPSSIRCHPNPIRVPSHISRKIPSRRNDEDHRGPQAKSSTTADAT
ncbi:MAG: hypothetical protein ABSG96_20730 [Terracidiphilus sp.]